ncbi:hypothetical protein ACGF7U_01445 [Micromonospora sp. NPDC047670]|uniref:hypothetical protein n=1 Tax=Micromonospora sp. NPDC047670 TaxID=3364252 RepID=UPI003711FC4F
MKKPRSTTWASPFPEVHHAAADGVSPHIVRIPRCDRLVQPDRCRRRPEDPRPEVGVAQRPAVRGGEHQLVPTLAGNSGALPAGLADDSDQELPAILAEAISHTAATHEHTCHLDEPGTPSATVIMLRRNRDHLEYLGCCRRSTRRPRGDHGKPTDQGRDSRSTAQRRSMPTCRPLRTHRLDGLLAIPHDHGSAELIRRVRAAEDSDPQGDRWPRGRTHDDATAAYCNCWTHSAASL